MAGVNLNTGFKQFETAEQLYTDIRDITMPAGDFTVRNYVAVVCQMSPEVRHIHRLSVAVFPQALRCRLRWSKLSCFLEARLNTTPRRT